jgi:phosphate transport system substrate-binding protein
MRSFRLWIALPAIAIAITTLVACNSKSANNAAQTVRLTGAGSTFVNPVMQRWISSYQSAHQGLQINYQSIGSGGGIQQLKQGLVDFGASDAALDDQQLKELPAPVVQIPESGGPVCVTYNLPDLKQPLRLTGETLAGIYLGTVKTWHDPQIAKTNPGVTLPNSPIVVAHRSDGSGTTNIFTNYLSATSEQWQKNVGSGISVKWPVGLGGKGSEGVTGIVKQTPGTIGYVELTYATENNLPVAQIQNKAGQFVTPTAESATAAIAAFADKLAQDVRIPTVNPPATAKDAYPISGLTYILISKDGSDHAKRAAVKSFVQFIVKDGQDVSTKLHYASLPSSIIELDEKLLGQLTVGGQPIP